MMGEFIQQRERSEHFLDEVLPHWEDEMPTTGDEIIETIKSVHELKRYPLNKGTSKYTLLYFQEEFA